MNIFVTGATGFIGSAVVEELIANGHRVIGMTRSRTGARKLAALGAKAWVGELDQVARLRAAAADSDGVIHTAFIHSLSHLNFRAKLRLFTGAVTRGIMASFLRTLHETETRAVGALGSALAGSGRPLVVTSGILMLPPGRTAVETDAHVEGGPSRAFSESATLAFVPRGVRASLVRLPPTVHGPGDHGFIPAIIKAAQKHKTSAYVGDGSNRWPAVHRLDAARLFRLVVEGGEAGGIYHGVAETGIPFREIAEKIGGSLRLPTASCSPEEAAKHFGFLSSFVGLDNPASSQWTQEKFAWRPQQPTLFADLDRAGYFSTK